MAPKYQSRSLVPNKLFQLQPELQKLCVLQSADSRQGPWNNRLRLARNDDYLTTCGKLST